MGFLKIGLFMMQNLIVSLLFGLSVANVPSECAVWFVTVGEHNETFRLRFEDRRPIKNRRDPQVKINTITQPIDLTMRSNGNKELKDVNEGFLLPVCYGPVGYLVESDDQTLEITTLYDDGRYQVFGVRLHHKLVGLVLVPVELMTRSSDPRAVVVSVPTWMGPSGIVSGTGADVSYFDQQVSGVEREQSGNITLEVKFKSASIKDRAQGKYDLEQAKISIKVVDWRIGMSCGFIESTTLKRDPKIEYTWPTKISQSDWTLPHISSFERKK